MRTTLTVSRCGVLLALGFASAAALGAAQTAPLPPGQGPKPVFRTGVDLLVVETTVVDRAGDVARGLVAADFKVEIGGKPRQVVSAEFVQYEDASAEPANADLTTNLERPSRTVLLVVDQSSLRFEQRGVLEGAKRWLTTLAPSDRLGFLGLPAPGPIVEFTTDHAKVLASFSDLKAGVGPTPIPHINRNVALWEAFQIAERNEVVRLEVVARECRARDPVCPGEILENAHVMATDAFTRTRPVLDAFGRVLQGLGALPGPKHVVLVSSGWPIEERSAATKVSALAAEASLANVTVHVFTAEEWAMAASSRVISPRRTFDQNLLLSSVETLAAATGGRAVRLAGNGEAAFKSLNGGLTGYYRLAVRPGAEDFDGAPKRINLELTRSGLSLIAYRRVMAGTRPSAPAAAAAGVPDAVDCDTAVREALKSGTRQTTLGLRATSYVLHGDSPGSMRVAIVGDVTGAVAGPATSVAVLFERDGRPALGTEQDVRMPAEGVGHVMTSLSVPPGEYTLRLVVCDSEGRVGTIERLVDARWRDAAGTAVTGLVLFHALGGPDGALQPVLDAVSTEDQVVVQMPLSAPPKGAGSKVAYDLTRDGPAASPLRLVGRLGKTGTGALVDEVVIAAGTLSPGHYTIAASIEPGASPVARRSFRVQAPPAK